MKEAGKEMDAAFNAIKTRPRIPKVITVPSILRQPSLSVLLRDMKDITISGM